MTPSKLAEAVGKHTNAVTEPADLAKAIVRGTITPQQLLDTLSYVLSKHQMVELGEKLIEIGSKT